MVHLTNQPIPFPASHDFKARQEIASNLKKGDIIFTKYRGSYFSLTAAHKPSSIITFFQALFNKFRGKKDTNEYYRTTHAVVVVDVDEANGRVFIAESLPLVRNRNQLREAELFSDPYLKLKAKDPWEYQVLRMDPSKGGKLPEQAAQIAQNLATKEFYLPRPHSIAEAFRGTHAYSFLKGMKSLLGKRRERVGTEAFAKRLFKQVADEHLRNEEGRAKATGGTKDRAFFCSYFAAHVYQQAELSQKQEDIEKLDGVKEGLRLIKKIKEGPERTSAIRKWAKEMGKRHRKDISGMVNSFYLDPKHTSPKELIGYLKRNELFKEMMVLAPASK